MRRTFKYRLKANKDTIQKTEEILNLCRQIYNLCLEQRIHHWKYYKKSISAITQQNQLVELKKVFPEYSKIPSQTLQDVVRRVDRAYQGFFRRVKKGDKAGFPRFKGYNRYDSFTLTQAGWKLQGNKLTISKIGSFKVVLHRPIEGKIKTITIRRTLTNKWFVCFACENVPTKPLPKTNKIIGIDMGCESFLTDSNGNRIDNPRFLKRSEKILTKRQQKLSSKKKGSHRRQKAKMLVAKIHEKISNQRQDFHFKVANVLVKENDIICIEKLNSWNTDWSCLNKSLRDVAWFNFFNCLKWKAEEATKEIIEVPAKDTSQLCSSCAKLVPKTLSDRIHKCPHCYLTIDRDLNSALNILLLGTSSRGSGILPREAKQIIA
ncbi:MAG: hypothetical protein DDT23_01300 [candidate division WS2 bacterium]|nr:hypothetical protein [Candidatus Lithacetigena glycinireducens]